MAPPISALRGYGLARQAQKTVGGGAPTLPFFHPSCSILKILLIMSRLSGFLKFAGEGFDVRASDRCAEQVGQLGGITDKLDLFAKPFRHCPETDL